MTKPTSGVYLALFSVLANTGVISRCQRTNSQSLLWRIYLRIPRLCNIDLECWEPVGAPWTRRVWNVNVATKLCPRQSAAAYLSRSSRQHWRDLTGLGLWRVQRSFALASCWQLARFASGQEKRKVWVHHTLSKFLSCCFRQSSVYGVGLKLKFWPGHFFCCWSKQEWYLVVESWASGSQLVSVLRLWRLSGQWWFV